MISSGLIIFAGGALCSAACLAMIPFAYKREKKKQAEMLERIAGEGGGAWKG